MATDFSYNGKTINSSGPIKPSGKNQPLDPRTEVKLYADIESIPSPYIGMIITVLEDETNSNKMTDYKVLSLKANASGIANSVIDQVQRYVDYLGAGSISQDDINTAVNNYLSNNPIQSVGIQTKELTTEEITSILGTSPIIPSKIEVQSIVIVNNHFEVNVGETVQLEYIILPSNATDKTVTWSSENDIIASVSQSGLVTAHSEGSALITATTSNSQTATAEIVVSAVGEVIEVTGITLSDETLSLNVGDTKTITATITPSDATIKSVTWLSSNDNIATVVNGKVTALQTGDVTIRATSQGNTDIYAECAVNIKEATTLTSVRDGLVGEFNFANLTGTDTEVYALNDETKKITFSGFSDIEAAKTNIGLSADTAGCKGLYNSTGIGDTITVAVTLFLKSYDSSSGVFKIGNIGLNTGSNSGDPLYCLTTPTIGFIGTSKVCMEANKYNADVLVLTIDKTTPSAKLYVNGNLVITSTDSSITTAYSNTLYIMSGFANWQRSSNLLISNNLLYNRVLDDNEITTITNELHREVELNTTASPIQTANSELITHFDIASLTDGKIIDYVQGCEITPTSTTAEGFVCDGTCKGLFIPNIALRDRTRVFKVKLATGSIITKSDANKLSVVISGSTITVVYQGQIPVNGTVSFNSDTYSLFTIVSSYVDNNTILNVYLNKNNIGSYVYTDKRFALKTFIADFNNSIPINQYIEYDTALSSDEISSLVSEMGCE